MSVQFGRWNFEGQPPAPDYIEKVSATLAPYGPDSNESYSKGGINILYRAFHTTKESHFEKQPHISSSGAVITWDGRLDNRAELISELRDSLTIASTDVAIVAGAYEKWGDKCLGRLIGDWALSIWNPRNRSVLLAKDPIGAKHLYYSFDDKQLTWSTILDPLVLFAGKTFEICEEYIAGWFSQVPAAHLTPYVGIHAVPPSSSVLLRLGKHRTKHTITKYWAFDPGKRIRYRTDAEYEEHFRTVFAQAVQRRLRSDRPVLAELSGGMDSSSIVCMADLVIACGQAECPRLDTLSWFDDSYDQLEPDTNELHWIAKVEEKRRSSGYHINLRELKAKEDIPQRPFTPAFDNDSFAATPFPGFSSEFFKHYAARMRSQGHRVTLSGIGGEQPTGGGMPTPKPELQNLLARARFFTLARQLNAWAAKMRKPPLPLLWEAVRGFFTLSLPGGPAYENLATPWFHPDFIRRNQAALCRYPFRTKLFGPLPSFQEHLSALGCERRLLAYFALTSEPFREVRYPYIDRDLREFAYSIPCEQLVRVGQRRSLMKRALVGIVPHELLNRKRKAFVPPPEPPKDTSAEWPSLAEIGQSMVGSSLRIIDLNGFLGALQKARSNEEVHLDSLKRTLTLELWLRHLSIHGVLENSTPTKSPEYYSRHSACPELGGEQSEKSLFAPLEAKELQAPVRQESSAS
jgi:asparagine synthase (glutamine-hydrolysing)